MTEYKTAENLNNFLMKMEGDFNSALSDDRIKFTQECIFARQQILKNSFTLKIALENQLSLKSAILNVAAVGLSLNPARQHAFLVPRDGQIVLDISYRGFLRVATDTGVIKWARAELVYENDSFEYRGAFKEPTLTANPFKDRGDIVGVYCCAKTVEGDYMVDTMDLAEIHKTRDTSQAYLSAEAKNKTNSPWHTWFGEMSKKTIIKRASKTWPQSDGRERLDTAVAVVNAHEGLAIEPFTLEEKETFDVHMNEGDALKMYVWTKSLPRNTIHNLYNSFPKGEKVKMKAEFNSILEEGRQKVENYIAWMELDRSEGDGMAAQEKLAELEASERDFIVNLLSPETQNWVGEIDNGN